MVSKKSKKAKRRNKPPRFRLMDRVAKKGFLQGRKVVFQPSGEVKMSEVLLEFVEPYKQFAQTEEAYRKMLTLAVVAWNASFLPEVERQVTGTSRLRSESKRGNRIGSGSEIGDDRLHDARGAQALR